MVLSECYGFSKYALVCVNLIFGAVGLGSVILAICMLTDQAFLVSLAQKQQNFQAGVYILLAAGNLMLIVAFLGCYGAFRESRCMLVGFFSCLLVVIVAQIAAGAWLYTNRHAFEELLKDSLIHTVKNEYGGFGKPGSTLALDAFQSTLGCCGATGPADWASSKYSKKDATLGLSLTVSADNNVYKVPESCCKEQDNVLCQTARSIQVAGIINPLIYNQGCVDKLIDILNSQSCIAISVAISIGILELLGLIFCLVLCCAIGSSDRYKA